MRAFVAHLMRSPGGAGIVAAGFALIAVMLVVVGGGYDLGHSAAALWNGSVGGAYSFLSGTLVRATPLIIVGLAVALAFQAGVLNIGADGQLLIGASVAVAVGLAMVRSPSWISIPAECVLGMAAGAAWAAIAAVLRRRFGVLEVISTLILNFVAVYAVSYLVRGPLQEPIRIYPYSASLGHAARLPLLIPGQQLHAGFVFAVVLAVALWWVRRSTAIGFRIRVVGAGMAAAASAGRVKVERVIFRTFLASGAIAGLCGVVQATGVTYKLFDDFSPGYGYTAIAVALLARLDPLAVIVTGVFFGGLEAGGAAMQRDAGVPSGFVSIIEALVVLGVLAVDRARFVAVERGEDPSGEPSS